MRRDICRGRGFTLIELLVVIAIIAILAAILFPLFTSARATAKTVSCASNMRQLAHAVQMYVDDNQGWMVPAFCEPQGMTAGTAWTWRYSIIPYVKNRGCYGCPSVPRASVTWGVPQMSGGKDDYASTYGLNMNASGTASTIWGYTVKRLDVYRRPSKVLMLLEIQKGMFYPYYQMLTDVPNGYLTRYFPYWHDDRMNMAFLDGHTTTMYLRDTLSTDRGKFLWCEPSPKDAAWQTTVSSILAQWPSTYPPRTK